MSTALPILTFPPALDRSSPPHTPSAPSPPRFFAPKISSGPGSGPGIFPPPVPPASLSQSRNFLSFNNARLNYSQPLGVPMLSPCSLQSTDAEVSETEPELSDDGTRSGSPPSLAAQEDGVYEESPSQARVTSRANFTIEDLGEFSEDDMEGRTDVIHPTTIEYAQSEGPTDAALDHGMLNRLSNLQCDSPDRGLSSDESKLDEDAHQAILKAIRERDRRHRMSKSSGTKRTMSDRGSDSSDHDEMRSYVGFEEAGSGARRLRKRLASDRRSLIFPDPPPRIDELVGAEELEEALAKELPFYEYTSMEVDSPRSPYE